MTNKQYFIQQLGFAPQADAIEAALIDAGFDGTVTYVKENRNPLKRAAIDTLEILLSTANTSTGSGETLNSVTYDRPSILKRIELLKQDLGIAPKSSLKAKHIW